MAVNKIRKILLLPIIISLCYISWQIYITHKNPLPEISMANISALFKTDNPSKQLEPTPESITNPLQKQYFILLQQYQIIRLKRLIAEEQRAIFAAKQAIANIQKTTPNLPSDQFLGLLTPNITPQNKSTPIIKKTTPQKPTSIAPTKTQTAEKEQNTLNLSPQETQSYQALEKFIAEKKQAVPKQFSNDEKWLLAVPPKDYTIQLYGAREQKTVQSFIKKNQLENAHVFHSYYLNKPWFALVVGKFKNYHAAISALNHMPATLRALKPWVRPMASVHAAIKLYR